MFPSSSLDFSYLTEIKKIELFIFEVQGCIFFPKSSKFKGFASLVLLLAFVLIFCTNVLGFFMSIFKKKLYLGKIFPSIAQNSILSCHLLRLCLWFSHNPFLCAKTLFYFF